MIVETKEFKQICSKILSAIDSSSIDTNITDTLELESKNGLLYLNVTNKEYYVSVFFPTNINDNLKATIAATTFLKLISQITTSEIELKVDNNSLNIKGNGNYKLPLIFNNDKLMELPKIEIINKTLTTTIDKSILDSIINYNSKEIIKENITKPVQKMYYIDDEGCITFTGTGACVNEFKLNTQFKILLNNKIIKLFKLFKSDIIYFDLGYDALSDNIIQTKIKLYDGEIELTAILSCDDSLINSVPVKAIRNKTEFNYPYSIVLDKNLLSQALNRLMVFTKNNTNIIYNYYNFKFNQNNLIISDSSDINTEIIEYQNGVNLNQNYSTMLNINELKLILDGCSDQYVTILFGNNSSILITRNNIKNILMEYSKD